jgi:hypothetical protein
MQDPTGIVVMAQGERPEAREAVERITIEKGTNSGVVVRVKHRPEDQKSGGELLVSSGVEEMNAFSSWPEAAQFVSGLMDGDATEAVEEEAPEVSVAESEPVDEPYAESSGFSPTSQRASEAVAGQRSYSR